MDRTEKEARSMIESYEMDSNVSQVWDMFHKSACAVDLYSHFHK